jgi:four helix bundle protein
MELVTDIYSATGTFPKSESFGLIGQLRRAAVSVPSNIAEGQGRRLPGDFKQFLRHARGSLLEIETQLLIARNLKYITASDSERLLKSTEEVGRVLNGLIGSL